MAARRPPPYRIARSTGTASMAELPADLPQSGSESRRYENGPLLYSDATYNVRDFISREDNESLDKSYGDGSPNEICPFKLDRGKIDELANDYRAETCVSSSRESSIQKEPRKETVKSDGTLSRNEDGSRCKSNRKRKTHREMPDGIIIDLSDDAYGTSRGGGGIRISVISTRNPVSEMKFIAIPKKHARHSTRNPSSGNKPMKKMNDGTVLTVLCAANCGKVKSTWGSKRKCKIHSRESADNAPRVDTTLHSSEKLGNILDGERELRVESNAQSVFVPNEILDSTECCHHDDTLINVVNARYPMLDTERTCVDARERIANHCCTIFNDTPQEYHICDRTDYSADSCDFNAEMQTDCTAECFHPGYARAKRCRCFHDSSECDPDINMQYDRRSPTTSRTAGLFENSALSKERQREEPEERLGSGGLRTDVAPEFSTEADEYSPDGVERCADCDGKKRDSAGAIRKRVAPQASVFAEYGGSVADPHASRLADTPRCEIDTRPRKRGCRRTRTTMVEEDGDRSYKSDLLKGADTRDVHAWRDDCIERRCAGRVVAEPSRPDQHPGEKGEFARGVDPEWKRDSIETDAQQLDYKWKRRITTVDAGIRASMDFKGKRDSRSQTKRSDNINDDGKRRETRDYSLWTSLQMGKIWSQVYDAYKNVVKLAATSVGRVVKDAPKSECSQRNPVEVADAMLVKGPSLCADKICGETCRKNLMRSERGKKTETRQERTIGDVGKYREDTEAPMRKSSQAIALSRDMPKHVYQNAEKQEDKESCVIYNEYERDKYQDIIEFPLRNETYSHDEDIYSRSRLSESFTYHESPTYPGFRSRGGSDDNRARGTIDKQKPIQHICKGERSIERNQNSISKTCICYDRPGGTRAHCTDRSSQPVARYELFIITDRADVPAASRNNPLQSQPTSISSPEVNRRMETPATPEQTRSREETETCESIEGTESGFTLADATEADPTVHSSRNNPGEPITSTSVGEAVSPVKSRSNRRRCRYYVAAKKFCKKQSSDIKSIASAFKRSLTSIGRKLSSTTASTTSGSEAKIMQIEPPSTVQITRGGNERRAYVNVQVQTPDAIFTRILSEFLLSGEKKRRILMTIMLQSQSDLDCRDVETQTSPNDLTSGRINMFDSACPRCATTSKTVQCFVCDKPDCYEIRPSDNSITLEEALITEYPETSALNDYYIAEQKADIKIPP